LSYSHRFHAGNHADVFKHLALVALLEASTRAGAAPVTYLETHAGEGRYTLGPTGEWTEGIGKLDRAGTAPGERGVLGTYGDVLARVGAGSRVPNRGGEYPGSPVVALAVLRPVDKAVLVEKQSEAVGALRRSVRHDARAEVAQGDGLAVLRERVADITGRSALVVHLDPAYGDPEEWRTAADALALCAQAGVRAVLWYPVKSLARPNTLLARLGEQKARATTVEVHVTPLDVKRNALNGSGMVFVNPPPGVTHTLAAQAAALGEALSTHDGRFGVRVQRTA
jgi:23S rRNA (adenine2030-N6)-methyltransferase